MHALLFILFGIACGLHAAQAYACNHVCYPPMALQYAYCYPDRTMFLVQAVVVEETGPLLKRGYYTWMEGMTEEEKKWYFEDNGFMRYTLAVKEIYRDDKDTIKPTSVIETWLGYDKCGMRLTIGKTYVLSGGWHVNEDNDVVMDTNNCEYVRQYDTVVNVKMPSCEIYNKRSQGHGGPVHSAAPVSNKRSQGHGKPPKFDIMKALGAAGRALNPFGLVRKR